MTFSWDVKREERTPDNAEWAQDRGIPSVTPSLSRASGGSQLAITECVCVTAHPSSQVQDEVDNWLSIVKEVPDL